jgi:hypothetical protein
MCLSSSVIRIIEPVTADLMTRFLDDKQCIMFHGSA